MAVRPELARLMNLFGAGILHMELYPEADLMCCEILVSDDELFIWADGDLIYCVME